MAESWRLAVLGACVDALFYPLKHQEASSRAASDPLTAELLGASGSSPELLLKVINVIETQLTPTSRGSLYLLLRLLNSRLGTLLLLGRDCLSYGMPQAFVSLPRERREAVLVAWSRSPRKQMRMAFKGIKSISMSVLFTSLDPDGTSPLLAALRYSVTDPQRPPQPAAPALAAEAAVAASLVDLGAAVGSPGGVAAAAAALAAKGMDVRLPDRVRLPAVAAARPQLVVKADAVVVGSGAGGGVAAARLAAAGLRVVVLEKAGFVPAAEMSLQEGQCFETMYERGGFVASEDGTVSILAGSTLGGGTRINWCASFKTPPHVRREWAEEHGLTDFASDKYDASMDAVFQRLSVHTGFQHPALCATLREGLQELGVHNAEVPRNCLGPDCGGHCCFGCARGLKQDSVNTWLADACQAGARILTGVYAERVVTDAAGAGGAPGQHRRSKRAVGVLCQAGNPAEPLRLVVQAPVVISACGTLHTPALLLRSGIKCRGNVGGNLRLHPATCVVGIFPPSSVADAPVSAAGAAVGSGGPDQRRIDMSGSAAGAGTIRPWEGTLMSVFSNQPGDWERSGYGSLLYTPAVHPGLFAASCPWTGGRDYKELMLQYSNACVVLVLTRDKDCGKVVIDREGRPRVHYTLSKHDEASMMKGVELGLRCVAAAGAETVLTLLNSPAGRFSFAPPREGAGAAAPEGKQAAASDVAGRAQQEGHAAAAAAASPAAVAAARGGNPAFEAYLADVVQTGAQFGVVCAHQMGTARLGVDPATSVLDPGGECWEVEGLYCCDGSTFPTPTGINPMITIEESGSHAFCKRSISHMLSGGIAERAVAALKKRGKWQRRSGSGVQLGYEGQESGAAAAKL